MIYTLRATVSLPRSFGMFSGLEERARHSDEHVNNCAHMSTAWSTKYLMKKVRDPENPFELGGV
jgi:hypothetical protein